MFSSEKTVQNWVLQACFVGCVLGFAGLTLAESNLMAGNAAALSASAKLNFRVVVPRVIYFSVGTASTLADNAAVDEVAFSVPQNSVGNGTPVAATSSSGGYPVTARVIGLGSSVSLTAAGTAGGLTDGTQSVPWSLIAASSSGTLPHPAIGDGAAGVATNLAATAGVVDKTSTWTFNYANTLPLASGSYVGQVTYTAALP